MDSIENTRSGLRPPSRIQHGTTTSSSCLQEITESQTNSRAQNQTMLPPPTHSLKRALNANGNPAQLPEPKRKTSVERGGEPISKGLPAPTVSVSSRLGLQGTSIASLAKGSNVWTKTTNNFSQSVGPGYRPPVTTTGRAPSAMGFNQSANTRQKPHPRTRPATAMGDRDGNGPQTLQQQPNGTAHQISFQSFQGTTQKRGVRGTTASLGSLPSHRRQDSSVEDSSEEENVVEEKAEDENPEEKEGKPQNDDPIVLALGKKVQGLSIHDLTVKKTTGAQVNSKPETGLSGQQGLPDVNGGTITHRRSRNQPPKPLPPPIPRPPETPRREKDLRVIFNKFENTWTAYRSPSPLKLCSPSKEPFLTKETTTLTNFTAWDVDERVRELDSQFKQMKEVMNVSLTDRKALEDAVDLAKTRVGDLERERQQLYEKNESLQTEIDEMRRRCQELTLTHEAQQRNHKYELEDKSREHRHELEEVRREFKDETDRLQRNHREEVEALERHWRAEIEDERTQKAREIQDLRMRLGTEQQDLNNALLAKEREVQNMRSQVEALQGDLDREQTIKGTLQQQIAEMSTTNMTLDDRNRALRAQIEFLESDSQQQSHSFAEMEARLQEALRAAEEAKQKLIKEETERRVLFNKYQELKGNIRVMCRVRPVLDDSEGHEAQIAFPDLKTSTQIDVTGPEERSSLGTVSRRVVPFEFDRVFSPDVHNEEVFGEISQLVQSALDGFNVCIFCYGQTGSGKTYTMSSADGMIPRATHMIYDTITKLKEKSWTYTMEGSFVEVYNEDLNDLLTPAGEGKKKLEIRHDDARKQTTVLNCKTVALDSADKVEMMLKQAQSNRSVAATKANERSSRSHSVFILKLVGENTATHERCEGTLNLVDLAGSERLKHSGAEGDRMKETQNINKSLACLGDVIEALGRGSAHIPYRNSKLTHLLQYSLGGNSKTLMFVMVSPLEAHLKETLTSLRFATKVHNTHIGTAKSTKKLKDRVSEA
ncbi:P-loop containing nucleoside triphosphate hydrolase protein [Naviculisporaceae sp. PSN 640]